MKVWYTPRPGYQQEEGPGWAGAFPKRLVTGSATESGYDYHASLNSSGITTSIMPGKVISLVQLRPTTARDIVVESGN